MVGCFVRTQDTDDGGNDAANNLEDQFYIYFVHVVEIMKVKQ